jgi:hypothetical protein
MPPKTAALSRRGSAKNGESGRPSGPQIVPIRRLTASNPAPSPLTDANNSAVFLNAWI